MHFQPINDIDREQEHHVLNEQDQEVREIPNEQSPFEAGEYNCAHELNMNYKSADVMKK